MEEQCKAGGKEFFFTVIWAIIVFIIGQCISSILQSYKMAGAIVTLLMYCIVGFFVLTRYSAVFTYSVKNNRVKINRMIGHKNKEVDFSISNVKKFLPANSKITASRVYHMSPKVFSKKGMHCIVYNKTGVDEAVVFEPSEKMIRQIKNLIKDNKNKEDNK